MTTSTGRGTGAEVIVPRSRCPAASAAAPRPVRLLAPLLLCLAAVGCAADDTRAVPAATSALSSDRPEATGPAESSGQLDREALPAPRQLGPRWRYRVDLGSVEDGYQGNGTPSMARDPRDVVASLAPLGCRPTRLPVPEAALEVSYGHPDGTPAVGLLLEFGDVAAATRFFQLRADAMRACADRPGAQAEIDVLRDRPLTFVAVRDERVGGTPVWTEGVSREGRRVLFVAVAGEGGRDAVWSAVA